MISQERLQLMTKLAAYEENEGKHYMAITSYFRSDYMGLQIIKSILGATIAFVIIIAMYIMYHFDTFMQDIYKIDLMGMGKKIIFYYLIFAVAYCVIAYIVYSVRFYRAKKSLKKYYHHLKQLSAMYNLENR